MRHYDGSRKWEAIESRLRRDGYTLLFSCASFDRQPDDFSYTGLESGWEMRRKLKAYCISHEMVDYRIVRNTSYHADLHGVVYELWTKPEGR